MTGMLRVPRSRGALSGVLLILLGVWGSLIAFVGPYFDFAYTPDQAWSYTSGRFWLEILPGAAAVIGGLILLVSSYRPMALLGAWLAALSGAWFAVGGIVGPAWRGAAVSPGTPVGGPLTRAAEQIGFFTGLGLVIAALAALALGRLSVISVRDARLAERVQAEAAQAEAAEAAASESASANGRAAQERAAADDRAAAADRAAVAERATASTRAGAADRAAADEPAAAAERTAAEERAPADERAAAGSPTTTRRFAFWNRPGASPDDGPAGRTAPGGSEPEAERLSSSPDPAVDQADSTPAAR